MSAMAQSGHGLSHCQGGQHSPHNRTLTRDVRGATVGIHGIKFEAECCGLCADHLGQTWQGGTKMKKRMRLSVAVSETVLSFGLIGNAQSQQADMTFFITSAGPGKGADLGGLAGADAHCQSLAQTAGAGNKTLACLPQHKWTRRRERG
jgi:hypothetical protein